MLKTSDERITITPASSASDIVFEPADWSVSNIPTTADEADALARHLYYMPVNNHVALLLCRHKRKERLKGLSMVNSFVNRSKSDPVEWKFLDTVCIWYEKPSSCSNNGLLPVSEPGFLVYKGSIPDTSKTKWFNEEHSNATNLWNLSSQPEEENKFLSTYHQKFSWEMNLLLMSLCGPLEYRRFIYAFPMNETELRSLHKMCVVHDLKAQLVASNIEEAEKMIFEIEKGM